MKHSKSYRFICLNANAQVVYYRWYTYVGGAGTAMARIKNKRQVSDIIVDEFNDADSSKIKEQDIETFGLRRCKQCYIHHSDGNETHCEKCINKPYYVKQEKPVRKISGKWLRDVAKATTRLVKTAIAAINKEKKQHACQVRSSLHC